MELLRLSPRKAAVEKVLFTINFSCLLPPVKSNQYKYFRKVAPVLCIRFSFVKLFVCQRSPIKSRRLILPPWKKEEIQQMLIT